MSGISSIYLFIAQKPNWQEEMDINSDGKIIQAECRYYLKENVANIHLEDGEQLNDIINKFWKSINSNKTGESLTILDSSEIDKLNERIEYYEEFEKFFKSVLAEFGGSDYNEIAGKYRETWIESVRTSLLNHLEGFISKGGKAEDVSKFLNGELDDNYYADPTRKNLKKLAMNMTTANAYRQMYLDQNEATKGHEFKDLEEKIDYYIQTLGDDVSVTDIKAAVKKIVDDYVATSLPSWKCPEEEQYLPLNEIQALTLRTRLQSVIDAGKSTISEYEQYKELYDAAFEEYITNVLASATRGTYVELLTKTFSQIVESPEFEEIKKKVEEIKKQEEAKKLAELQKTVISYCKTQAARGDDYADCVTEVFGESYEDKIKAYEDLQALQDDYTKLQELIGNVKTFEEKTAEIINSLPASVTSGSQKFTFYVDKGGNIQFIIYDKAGDDGIFSKDNEKNSGLNKRFEDVKGIIESKFADDYKKINLTEAEKKNLFNAALFLTLTDTSVVGSFYNTTSVENVMKAFVNNYAALLKKVIKNEKAREYITKYAENSYLAGTTTMLGNDSGVSSDMKGFKLKDFGIDNDATQGKDDMISLSGETEITLSTSEASGTIIHLSTGSSGDDNAANNAMDNMAKKYVEKYGNVIDKNRIFELFKMAQRTAIDKLKKAIAAGDPDDNPMENLQVYAYGDYGGKKSSSNTVCDGLCSIASLLIQIELEMERLIGIEIMK